MDKDVWRVGGVGGVDTSTKGLCQYRTSESGTGKLLVSALTVADTATFRGAQTFTGAATMSGALTVAGTTTLNGAVSATDSDIRFGSSLPSGNDTSAFGIGRIYTDSTNYLKITTG